MGALSITHCKCRDHPTETGISDSTILISDTLITDFVDYTDTMGRSLSDCGASLHTAKHRSLIMIFPLYQYSSLWYLYDTLFYVTTQMKRSERKTKNYSKGVSALPYKLAIKGCLIAYFLFGMTQVICV